jgi:hypothetical protein
MNPFSPNYVSQLKTDHRDRTFKRPEIKELPKNMRANLNGTKAPVPMSEQYRRISRTKI